MTNTKRRVYVAATYDTKGHEAEYVAGLLARDGLDVVTVDVSTTGASSAARVQAREVAARHPGGAQAVFTGDRGTAIAAMALAFERYAAADAGIGALLGLGGSGGTALITPAMRALPIGVPKLMVSTMASGNVAPYVGPSDIAMMYSVTDVAGLNRISRRVLANAAGAIGGAFRQADSAAQDNDSRPAVGISMFGVTTACVQQVVPLLEPDYDCLVFHATGTGGQSMEKLLDSHLLSGVLDLTTTEVCDFLFGGVLACTEDRFGAVARTRAPYVGACGAAGHGELRRHGDRAGTLPGPPVLSPQSAGDADAHHARRERPPGRVDRQPAEPLRRAGALPDPRGRGVGAGRAGPGLLGSGGRRRVVHRAGNAPGADRRPPPGAGALPHQRPAVRPHGGRAVP